MVSLSTSSQYSSGSLAVASSAVTDYTIVLLKRSGMDFSSGWCGVRW